MKKSFLYRFIIYGIVATYMLLDIKVFQGPVYQWVIEQNGEDYSSLRARGVVALVYGQPIMREQVEYRMEHYYYVRGLEPSELGETSQDVAFRFCLEELIREHLLRVKVHHNENELNPISPEQIQSEMQWVKAQFSDEREYQDAIARQYYGPDELALRTEAHAQQRQYLSQRINIQPETQEVSHTVQRPDLYRLRHIFRTTYERDAEEVKTAFLSELALLEAGEESFAACAARLSQDPQSKDNGGALGWVSNSRLPKGLDLTQLPLAEPVLIQSEIGWHYLEVLEHNPAQELNSTLPALRMENEHREEGLKYYLRHLRVRESKHVKVLID